MISDEKLAAAIEEAVTPTPADLLTARQLFIQLLSGNPSCVVGELEDRWLASVGAQRPAPYGRDESPLVEHTPDGLRLINPSDVRLLVEKARRVTAITLSDLVAEGVIVESVGNNYNPPTQHISITYAGGGDSLIIPDDIPKPISHQARVKLRRRRLIFDAILTTDDYLAGLDHLLGVRGERAIREARDAMTRGLFLAGASLLAAGSEAAWFNLGRAVPGPSSALQQSLASGRDPAQVVEAVTKHAQDKKLLTATQLNEIRADAHHFRDIRNYALHPVDALDTDREAWLSEAGCAVLLISSRRYFVRLAGLLTTLNDEAMGRPGV